MRQSISTGIVGLTVSMLLGCGGTGTLSLHLTDAPPDTENMSAVMVTIASVEVHLAGFDDDKEKGDDDAGWRILDRPPQSYDLLRLQNDVTAELGAMELPEGKITQIRLHLDPGGVNEVRLVRGDVCPLDLTKLGKTGVKINHPFKAFRIEAGRTTTAVVDFDVKESVSKDADCVYRLHPVIKLKSVKHD